MTAATQLLVLQADSAEQLRLQVQTLARECATHPQRPLVEVAAEQSTAPLVADHRLAAVAATVADLERLLSRAVVTDAGGGRGRGRAGLSALHVGHRPMGDHGRIAWLFPGEGAQYAGMLADLCVRFPAARRCFDLLDRAVGTDPPPSRAIFPPTITTLASAGDGPLWQMGAAVAAVITANRAVAEVLHTLGLSPDVLVGHSTGEYSALLESRALDLPDDEALVEQLRLGDAMGRKVEAAGKVPTGALLTTALVDGPAVAEVLREHAGRAWLALDNCPSQQVVFATPDVETSVTGTLRAAGALVQPLPFGRAYHTPLFSCVDEDLAPLLRRLPLRAPTTEVWSSASAAPYPDDPEGIRQLLTTQWASPVRFRETLLALHEKGVRIFIEAGPRGNLRQFVADTLGDRPHLAVAADHHRVPGLTQLQHLAAVLLAAGVPVDLTTLRPHGGQPNDAPSLALGLPVMRLAGGPVAPPSPSAARPESPPLPTTPRRDGAGTGTGTGVEVLDLHRDRWLRDHSLGGPVSARDPDLTALVVVPLTISLELMARTAVRALPGRPVRAVRDVRAHRWLVVPDDEPLTLALKATPGSGAGDVHVTLAERGDRDDAPSVEATVELGPPALPDASEPLRLADAAPYGWRPDELYAHGMFHGPTFRGVRSVDGITDRAALATVEVSAQLPGPSPLTAPLHSDAAGQLVGFWTAGRLTSGFAVFPRRVDRIELPGTPLPTGQPLHAGLQVREVTHDSVVADLELHDATHRRLWRATGWQDTRARLPAGLLRLRIDPAGTELSEEWPWPPAEVGEVTCRRALLGQRLPASDASFWLDVLASLVLSRSERETWRQVRTTRRARDWLAGRVAVKDAVRRSSGSAHRGYPADVEVTVDRHGAPLVEGASLAVSISHRGSYAVAVAAPGARGIGIDLELLSEQPAALGDAVLSPGEAEACGLGPVSGETALRLWCAKEAAAKALGHGLPSGPMSLVVVDAEPDASRVRLVPGSPLVALDAELRDEQLTAYTTREHDLIAAIARR
jgi:malonyl CoA-acyl carrier protein transacylase/phosphopantetheinyl transferase